MGFVGKGRAVMLLTSAAGSPGAGGAVPASAPAALGPAVHLDFAEHRSQAAKIKVNPRGNLWATGHFMGKKSVTGSPHLESPEEPAVPMVFGPSLRALLEDMMELLTRELLKILLQERLLDENQGKYDLTDQETGLLTKVLEKYFSN
ncbi:PREDICTED: neuromedin-B [Nipponia nippon]|uniref:neuromedin-B n=1 Tax=Nipponia nippon TaxID=128390 RepID=UPI000510C9DB|nr:PREDICTED: neuromedin-B [Nipponia nippon]